MSMLKLLVNLNSSSHFKLMMICHLSRLGGSQSNKQFRLFCVCSSLSNKRSHRETETIEKSQNESEVGDYFGVEFHSDTRKKEHEREKEAWLKSLETSTRQNEDKLTTEYNEDMAKHTSVKEVQEGKSEIVEKLLTHVSLKHEKKELTVPRTYGSIRFDKKKLDDMVKTKDNRKKDKDSIVQAGSINVHRVSNIAGKSVRKSFRMLGNRYEILKMGRSLRVGALKDNGMDPKSQCDDSVQESGLSFIEDQYFYNGAENEQLGTVSQTEIDARTAGASVKQSSKQEQPQINSDMDSFINVGATVRNIHLEEDDFSYIDQEYFREQPKINYQKKVHVFSRKRTKPEYLHSVGEEATSLDSIGKDPKSEDLKLSFKEESGSDYIEKQYFDYDPHVQVRQDKAMKGVMKEIIQKDELLGASVGDDIVGKLDKKSSDNFSDHSLTKVVKRKRGDSVEKNTKSQVSSVASKEMSGLDIDFDPHLRQDKARKKVTKEMAQKGERQNAFVGSDKLAKLHEQSVDNISNGSLKDLAATTAIGKSSDDKKESPKKITEISLKEPARAKKPETAYEVAIQKRRELEVASGRRLYGKMNPNDTDSKGFRILTKQVPDFTNVPSCDIAALLKQNIVYDDHDIVAFNKPYGLNATRSNTRVSVEYLLNKIIPSVKLHFVSGLGKETTGVLLCAKTSDMAKVLLEALNQEKCVKRYIVVTKNTPKLPRGEINIPLADGFVDGKVRKVLRPYGDSEFGIPSKLSKDAERAVTRYEVLDKQDRCALLECRPLTNVRQQIRAHLALGLNCPILGDHKYAHLDKMVPMKLHPIMLQRLGIRQAKVRTVPMHFHLRSVVIPEFLNGQNLVISAPFPGHLVKNVKSLRLRFPPRK